MRARSHWMTCRSISRANRSLELSGRFRAAEALLVIGAARARVLRLLRIGAQRPRARLGSWWIADNDPLGRVPALDPMVNGRDRTEHERTLAASTVAHAG